MFRNAFAAGALAALMSTSAAWADVEAVSDIRVTADLAAMQNDAAAAYWGQLPDDLTAAIASRLGDRTAEQGAVITVDIRGAELASTFDRVLDQGDAVLVGQVIVLDETDPSNEDAYQLSVSLGAAQVPVIDGQAIILNTANEPEVYARLVDTFADQVVERLK